MMMKSKRLTIKQNWGKYPSTTLKINPCDTSASTLWKRALSVRIRCKNYMFDFSASAVRVHTRLFILWSARCTAGGALCFRDSWPEKGSLGAPRFHDSQILTAIASAKK